MHAGREHAREALLELVAAEPLGLGLDTQRLVRGLPEGVRIDKLPQRLTALVQQVRVRWRSRSRRHLDLPDGLALRSPFDGHGWPMDGPGLAIDDH